MDIFNEFVQTLNTETLDKKKSLHNSAIGWCQFVDRQKIY